MTRRHDTTVKRDLARSLILLLLLTASLLLLFAAAASADPEEGPDGLQFSLEPTSTAAQPSGYFVISAEPGQSVKQVAVLRNLSEETIDVTLAAVDGTTGLYGGVTYALPTDEVKAVGSWITISQTQVQLEPGGSKEIPFTINVPNDAPSGMNVGGLTAWVPNVAAGTTTTTEGFSAQVIIQTRRVLAVQVNLPGDAEPVLEITGVTANPRPSGMELDIAMNNTGHGLAGGKGTITVSDGDFTKEFELGDVLPGTGLAYPIVWISDPEEKTYDATVHVEYNGRVADWSGTFRVGKEAITEMSNYQTTTTAGAGAEQAASKPFKLSTTVIIAIAVGAVVWLILVATVVMLMLGRAKRRRAARERRRRVEGPPESGV